MRVLLWHGWLLDGTGSNVYTARVAEVLARDGHDVVVVCQERHVERHPWVDAHATVSARGVGRLEPTGAGSGAGRAAILRPDIGRLLPVFVLDDYEGFRAKRFVDLADDELDAYLDANVAALRAAAAWHRPDVVIAGHAVPGGPVAGRALGRDRYVVKVHGSDVEYAIRLQERYRRLAGEALGAATAVTGSSQDVLDRLAVLVPAATERSRVVHPGVDSVLFSPRPRRDALLDAAARLEVLDTVAEMRDGSAPDRGSAAELRALASGDGPIVGYLGKLIPQKGVALLIAALTRTTVAPRALIVGFGSERELLEALAATLRSGDLAATERLARAAGWPFEISELGEPPLRVDVRFTGRLDHAYAPDAVAAMDVLVVPSVLDEAFGMVAAEGAAAGALPLLARHSGLAEVAGALERHVDRPGLFSFEPGPRAVGRIAAGIDRLLSLPPRERDRIRAAVRDFVSREWSWLRTAARLLDAADAR